ncbi:hypothetical protein OUZ56_013199 [Daphnia magna]|uniref:DNA 3'-5' helicase n=1 Tax=Daphnia magna TaxID=35525 RepID=A0ABQ9Z574_9CRUS|nr:hypothetical protein OUZ56_013199 [Daphnia magna]
MSESSRKHTQCVWMSGSIKVICATLAFGMGIDKSDVKLVIHYTMPKSLEMFHQESGRAGRDGQIAYSLLYYTYSDSRHQKWLLNKNQSIGNTALRRNHDNLMSMLSYCENIVDCRRVLLLKHFGEEYNREKCLENEATTCDNCACNSEVREVDVTLIGKAVVALVLLHCGKKISPKNRLTLLHFSDILNGKSSKKVMELGHNKWPIFGKLDTWNKSDVDRLLHSLVIQEFLEEIYLHVVRSSSNT